MAEWFEYDGFELAYESYGEGPRVTVLLHGLLFSRRMHDELARALADRGHRVITLDLLGHGASDRPHEMWHYSMGEFGREVVALLDRVRVSARLAHAPSPLPEGASSRGWSPVHGAKVFSHVSGEVTSPSASRYCWASCGHSRWKRRWISMVRLSRSR